MGARPVSRHRQRGQSMAEFAVIFPVVIMLVFGILQVAFLYQGKSTLNYATMLAARAGAMNNGDANAMRNALSRGLAPMFAGRATPDGFAEALAKATAETREASYLSSIEVLNPTAGALQDFGRARLDGQTGNELPNDTLNYRSTAPGGTSGISIQDANLLHVRVTYCYRLIVPVIGRMIRTAVNTVTPAGAGDSGSGMSNPFGIGADPGTGVPCSNPAFDGPRIEVRSEAIVRMQSPFFASNTGASGSTTAPSGPGGPGGPGGPTNPGNPGDPADPGDPEVPGVPGVPSCP